MPGTPEMQFPGAWPESPPLPYLALSASSPAVPSLPVMDHPMSLPLGDSLQESQSPSFPSRSSGSATHIVRKPPPLRIIVPPTEYCPFSTDLTLPITPLSLPTPVASSCFTFNDMQDPAIQSVSATPAPLAGPVHTSCTTRETVVTDFASPTSSQFLLLPPTPHLENVEIMLCVSPVATPHAAIESIPNGSDGAKSANLRPWEVSSSTWLTDLGGYTETDRIFRHNLLEMNSTDSDSSPVSTPALSPSAVSPSSLVSSVLATTLARSPASLPLTLSPCTMSPPSASARLVLKPTGTDAFPSMLDSLQTWRENVTFGSPPEEEPRSPFSEDAHCPQTGEAVPETAIYTDVPPLHSRRVSTRVPHISRSRTFIKHAKRFGGRMKQLVTRRNINEYRGSMDRGISFRVVTSRDSENGSVILITAPPPLYDNHPLLHIPHEPAGQDYVRPRTTSEYSSAVQTSTAEVGSSGMLESDTRRGGRNRNTLRRLSLAALSTIKRL